MDPSTERLKRAFERIDEVNAGDPRRERADGAEWPKELLYAERMSQALARFQPHASEALRLAARAQHIGRWTISRSDFPTGRLGYKRWRTKLMDYHATLAAEILQDVGYDVDMIERVRRLLRKQGLKRDEEVQTLEDVVCLVFLEHYFEAFAREHDDEKLVDILQKTWAKMSERGRRAALQLELGERTGSLVNRALAATPTRTTERRGEGS